MGIRENSARHQSSANEIAPAIRPLKHKRSRKAAVMSRNARDIKWASQHDTAIQGGTLSLPATTKCKKSRVVRSKVHKTKRRTKTSTQSNLGPGSYSVCYSSFKSKSFSTRNCSFGSSKRSVSAVGPTHKGKSKRVNFPRAGK